MAAVYQIIEGIITTVLAKQYRSSFAYKNGITNAFLCSFYRVATLGSGSGVAAIIYLGEHGIEYGGGFGLYMIQYALHKISIALFSAIFFVMNWEFMRNWFGDYAGLLAGGYAVTLVITIGLFLFCCSKKFHRLIFRLLDIVNQKFHGRFEIMEAEIKRQCMMLEDASKHLLKNKKATTGVIFLCLLKCCFWYGIPYLLFKGVQFQGNPALTLSQVLAIVTVRYACGGDSVSGGNWLYRVCVHDTFCRNRRHGHGGVSIAFVPLWHICISISGGNRCRAYQAF